MSWAGGFFKRDFKRRFQRIRTGWSVVGMERRRLGDKRVAARTSMQQAELTVPDAVEPKSPPPDSPGGRARVG